ncbi:MAG: thiamine pyrophosphate-dependent dehydrogenase E1 component subunit alpha, partial [Firmicutes bacterium]|nr:thiamine pyrophosphate-dependent dehydrogenase E1 component subunit alpha [Bacillota bacterium]
LVLQFGLSIEELLLAQLGKKDDPGSGGRQMPAHWSSRRQHILTASSPVTTQIAHAAGMAWAFKRQREDAVVAVFLGEGSTSQGEFHESLNFSSIHHLPLLVVVENNGYAISVPQSQQMAIEQVADRAAGYGITGITVLGTDPEAIYEAGVAARKRAVAGQGPTLIEVKTYRYKPHSSDDDDRSYRTAEELEAERADDPIDRWHHVLESRGLWSPEKEETLRQDIQKRIHDATTKAFAASDPDPSTLLDQVYSSQPLR